MAQPRTRATHTCRLGSAREAICYRMLIRSFCDGPVVVCDCLAPLSVCFCDCLRPDDLGEPPPSALDPPSAFMTSCRTSTGKMNLYRPSTHSRPLSSFRYRCAATVFKYVRNSSSNSLSVCRSKKSCSHNQDNHRATRVARVQRKGNHRQGDALRCTGPSAGASAAAIAFNQIQRSSCSSIGSPARARHGMTDTPPSLRPDRLDHRCNSERDYQESPRCAALGTGHRSVIGA